MKEEKLTVIEVYHKVRSEAQHYYEHIGKAKNEKQKELYVNLHNSFNLVSMWLEQTDEVNPK